MRLAISIESLDRSTFPEKLAKREGSSIHYKSTNLRYHAAYPSRKNKRETEGQESTTLHI